MASVRWGCQTVSQQGKRDLMVFCRAQQSSFGSSGRPSRCYRFLREVAGRWPRFAEVVELQSINGKGRLLSG